jgi:hypothetical protein
MNRAVIDRTPRFAGLNARSLALDLLSQRNPARQYQLERRTRKGWASFPAPRLSVTHTEPDYHELRGTASSSGGRFLACYGEDDGTGGGSTTSNDRSHVRRYASG